MDQSDRQPHRGGPGGIPSSPLMSPEYVRLTPWHTRIAVFDREREDLHTRPHSDRGLGQGGEVNGRSDTDDDPGNGQGRFEWTSDLRDDLMQCYESSSPARRGYMARMHARWCNLHPNLDSFTSQNLRDYVSYLRRIGYVRVPRRTVSPANQEPIRVIGTGEEQGDAEGDVVPSSELINRTSLHHRKKIISATDLEREDLALREGLSDDSDIWHINCAVYQSALRLSKPERTKNSPTQRAQNRIRQMSAKIQLARQEASRVQCVVDYRSQGRPFTTQVRRIATDIRRVHHTLNEAVLATIKQHCLDRVRMLMVAKRSLVRRLKAVEENNLFRERPSRLFQPSPPRIESPPTVDQVEAYWRGIYEQPNTLNVDTPALVQFESFCSRTPRTEILHRPINAEEVLRALEGTKNFAAPGPDGINNYWWKKFPSCHRHLARIFNSWLNEEQAIPPWFVEGRTVLLPKNGDLSDPKNYRPITCLNSCYKLFTRILYNRILQSVNPVFLSIYEQRGSKKGIAGCRENLLIDRCVTQDSIQYKRNLSMAWIDYRKAFDTTSHELISRLLECLAIDDQIVRCIRQLMPLWKTRFAITTDATRVRTELVSFKRGVFQGDSLSPLLFCISLLPLSVILRNMRGYGCGVPGNRKHKITHLFYMDDLKLYASGKADLQQSLRVVQRFTHDIGMEFGVDKCAMVHLKKGRRGNNDEEEQLVDGSILRHLDAGETYKYLGMQQHHTQDAQTVKAALRCKYQHRLRQIWSSELSGKNKVGATNMLAVPIILYSFGAVKWNVDELRQLDVKTRKMMHINRSLHPRSSIQRIYLPRDRGGRGLLSLECLHSRVILSTTCVVLRSTDPLLRLVREHEQAGVGAFLFKAARRAAEELGLKIDFKRRSQLSITELTPTQLKAHVKNAEVTRQLRLHKDKPLHGLFYKHLEEHGLSEKLSFSFLRASGLKSETEGFIMACQDGVYNTLIYRSSVMGIEVPDTSCRACHRAPETITHLLSACSVYAVSAYIHRHNAALRVLYYHLRHYYGVDETPVLPYAPGDIESVVENEKCRIYWNYSFPTLRLIRANKPDVVLFDHYQKAAFIIEFSAPAEVNVAVKEGDKRAKYQDLLYDVRRLYPEYTFRLVVLVIGSLGGMRNSFLAEIRSIPACAAKAHILANNMQKAVILGSLRLLRAHDSRTQ